jgi:hypothetical protein
MKRLIALFIIITVLFICSPSNAYILVYKLTSTVKSIETDANAAMNFKVNGYVAMDVNDVEKTVGAEDSLMVMYGRDLNDNYMYYIEDFSGNPKITWKEQGAYLTFETVNHLGAFDYDLRLIGKIKEKNVGLGSEPNQLRNAPPSLKGSMYFTNGMYFDPNQQFFGSGSAKMTLDTRKTYAANATPLTQLDIITAIVEDEHGLLDKGYQLFVIP